MPVYDYKFRRQLPEISSCVGFWKFEETAGSYNGTASECKDSSGQGNDGKAVGDANTFANSKVGNGCTFDGNDNIEIPDSTDFYYDTGNFVISTWVRFDSGTIHAICGQVIDNSNRWQFGYNNTAWSLFCATGGTDRSVSWNWTIGYNTWYHLCVVRSASNTYTLYIDGLKITQTSNTGSRTSWPNIATVMKLGAGFRAASVNRYLTGDLDEFFILKGASLDNIEVAKLANGHSMPTYWGSSTSLITA